MGRMWDVPAVVVVGDIVVAVVGGASVVGDCGGSLYCAGSVLESVVIYSLDFIEGGGASV